MNSRISELEPKSPPEGASAESAAESSAESSGEGSEGKPDVAGGSEDVSTADEKGPAREREGGSKKDTTPVVENGNPPKEAGLASEGGEGSSEQIERTEEEKVPLGELDILKNRRDAVMMEMLMCSQFHHVFEDTNADDGLVPDMPRDDEEGGDGETSSEASSEAGEGGTDDRPRQEVDDSHKEVDDSSKKVVDDSA